MSGSMRPVWVWQEAAVPDHAFLVGMRLMLLRYLPWEEREERGLVFPVKEPVEAREGFSG